MLVICFFLSGMIEVGLSSHKKNGVFSGRQCSIEP
ncbi:hypothetical protein SLEP1_g35596 [Rubroshorea leprosula]|uniref:Uncharacterized protein n=1 Tax=Rubroshorea leprosula TaxID=152421 RepID=A0AAV5KNZ0_9ROSI|nr:hypothetical protein SLEP1_g35596 [Rubroshorea leprosula]